MGRTKLYVGNLPENCPLSDLQSLFEQHGKVEECDIVKNYGFVHMSTEDEAKTVIEALNNFEFMGSKITVEISHSKVRQKPGMGGKGQCYRCGRQGHWSKECPKNPNARLVYKYHMHPMHSPGGYGDRPMPRYGGGFVERSYGQRYAPDRMRPYPDPYERRHGPPHPSIPRDDYYYYYYRRPYEEYGYAPPPAPPPHLSGGPAPGPPSVSRPPERYNFTDDPTFE
ncbi:RNA-binding protein lark-like [Centruroides vittatus]|uniref:RNA-binding protein 4.1-like n=1 Tax=Centruroides sculpturatus TaxID=218467 RepID=UPI000C6E387D|nr:RNA-binding protein 4.1-like [Centruroides sculpturatus]